MCWNQYTVAAITNLALELHRTLLTGSNYKYSQANCKAKPPQALTAPSYKRKWKRRWIELSDSRDGREGIGSYPNLQDYFWGEGKFDDILSYHIYIKFIENDRAFLGDRSVRKGRLWSHSWRGEDLLLCHGAGGTGVEIFAAQLPLVHPLTFIGTRTDRFRFVCSFKLPTAECERL